MTEYDEHFIATFTGKQFHYLDPKPEEIDIQDIAHALSLVCRFGGHCREFYSVAQHSVLVASIVDRWLRLPALLHDAHEAYLHDVPRPIKHDMQGYKEIADRIQVTLDTIYLPLKTLWWTLGVEEQIKRCDDIILATEARDLMSNTIGWSPLPEPLEETIDPWGPRDAEETFLDYFNLWRAT